MIVLDTNIISEMMKPAPHPSVHAWFNAQVVETLYISSITVAELSFGIEVLPDGKKRTALTNMLNDILKLFDERILMFDTQAAQCYAKLAVHARLAGRGFPTPDGYIAAIAVSKGFIVVTRDTSPFTAAALKVINPFDYATAG